MASFHFIYTCLFPEIAGMGSLMLLNNSVVPRGIDQGQSPCFCNRGGCSCFAEAKSSLIRFLNTSQTPEPTDGADNLNGQSGNIKPNSHTAGS